MPPEQRSRKQSYVSYIVGALVLLAVVIGGFLVWKLYDSAPATTPPQQQEQVPVVANEPNTYASSTLGFSIQYPKEFSANDAYAYAGFSKKPISGVKFTIPLAMATGTNLSATDTGVSVEWLPRAKACTGDIYLKANVKPVQITQNGLAYSVATSSEGTAGNLYEEIVYAIASSTPCTAIRYVIHSTNIGNYPVGAVRPFDRAALIAEFDKIRESLTLTR